MNKPIITSYTMLAITRIALGCIFLWAFVDKTFGLGFATTSEQAWINGGSPTTGFLTHAVTGPLANTFHQLAGVPWVDWMFMIGLFVVGVTLITNKWVRLGSIIGIVMLLLMYLALLWPANNPVIDDHIIYALILGYFALRGNSLAS